MTILSKNCDAFSVSSPDAKGFASNIYSNMSLSYDKILETNLYLFMWCFE